MAKRITIDSVAVEIFKKNVLKRGLPIIQTLQEKMNIAMKQQELARVASEAFCRVFKLQ